MGATLTAEYLVQDFKKLGVQSGDLLNVKCSMRSVGHVQGGAATLVEALLECIGPEGTIVTDSFIKMYSPRQAKSSPRSSDDSPSYAGALANAIIAHPRAFRSKHPVQKFAAIGKEAQPLMESHTKDSYAYDVLRKMSLMGGKNLKIGTDEKVVGVGTTHVAIGYMGFRQKLPVEGIYYKDEEGHDLFYERNWASICSEGLIKFIPYYRKGGAILSEGHVGEAEAKITDMAQTLKIEIDILKKEPDFFMCKKKGCLSCQLGWRWSKGNPLSLLAYYLRRKETLKAKILIRYLLAKKKFYPENPRPLDLNGLIDEEQ